jgi:hypothetical protein
MRPRNDCGCQITRINKQAINANEVPTSSMILLMRILFFRRINKGMSVAIIAVRA